jgi:hydroxypyruvate reductase
MKPRISHYRQHVDSLIAAALAAADPAACVRRALRREGQTLIVAGQERFDLSQGRLFLVSAGKASVAMARAAISVLGEEVTSGIVICKKSERDWRTALNGDRLAIFAAGHPVSDEAGLEATAAVVRMLERATTKDLVLCLISGGTSALLTQPLVPLADWQALTAALLGSGCTINELNAVRRQLDRVKGGGLARIAAPATCYGLILSDVVGNPLEFIGSGPTVAAADPSEQQTEAAQILGRYDIAAQLGRERWQRLTAALRQIAFDKALPEDSVRNFVIGDVRQAAVAAQVRAMQMGFVTHLLTTHLEGEAREVGRVAAAIARDLAPGHCLILGGETTVTVRGDGMGGRNQELALAAAIGLDGSRQPIGYPVVVASFATDGEDGPIPIAGTISAGAIVHEKSATLGRKFSLEPLSFLDNNDSYHFFQQLDEQIASTREQRAIERSSARQVEERLLSPSGRDSQSRAPHHIITGPTGTNVNDLLFILSYEV